ncbi:MAG TPA: hypothetical protein VFE65_15130 [Pseudonocardia sp.]|nr:hypothetical protein [Pseudonocardia sp.]
MSRHRHAINVRADGLATVLGPMSRDPAVLVALLVDVDSGMVLDACGPVVQPGGTSPARAVDVEELGAAHGELMRLALGAAGAVDDGVEPSVQACEITVELGTRRHVVLRRVSDPHGDRLVLSVLIEGPARTVRRVRRRLGEVSASALTAGPSVTLRPGHGAWVSGGAGHPGGAGGPGAAGHLDESGGPGAVGDLNGAGSAGATGHPGWPGGPAAAGDSGGSGRAGAANGSNGLGRSSTARASGGPVLPGPGPPDELRGPHPSGPHPAGPHASGSDDQRHEDGSNGAERSPAPPSALPPPTRTGA